VRECSSLAIVRPEGGKEQSTPQLARKEIRWEINGPKAQGRFG